MLVPSRVKHRKQHRGRMHGKATRGNTITFGEFGLVALECGWITNRQIEAARIAMTRYIKRGGQVWIKIFPDKPVTAKPAETRMGSGKGSPEYWVAVVKPGRVMFELNGVSEEIAREALRLAMHKLPIKCKFVTRADQKEVTQMKTNDFRDMTNEEVLKEIDEFKTELFNLRFQLATGQLDNPMRIREVRKGIARGKTILRERELKIERV